jgi:flagellar biosynthesis chaperone FliJ
VVADTRGFEYSLEPVRQRSHHQVVAAVGKLGQTQRELAQAREQVDAALERCRVLAEQATPAARAAIDPARAIAVARHMMALRQTVVHAQEQVVERERAVAEAQAVLDRARIERETFESHRAELLAEHAVEQARRHQALADQDWLARRSFTNGSEPTSSMQRGSDEAQ